jgi:hypothetical protein
MAGTRQDRLSRVAQDRVRRVTAPCTCAEWHKNLGCASGKLMLVEIGALTVCPYCGRRIPSERYPVVCKA